jgi:superfamily I DNA and RNA helicase
VIKATMFHMGPGPINGSLTSDQHQECVNFLKKNHRDTDLWEQYKWDFFNILCDYNFSHAPGDFFCQEDRIENYLKTLVEDIEDDEKYGENFLQKIVEMGKKAKEKGDYIMSVSQWGKISNRLYKPTVDQI